MTADVLRDFASRIGAARVADQRQIFDEMQPIFCETAPQPSCWLGFKALGAYNDAAIALYRDMLPDFGFQFGTHAPYEDGIKGLATTWRASDSHAAVFEAATPALALLRATAATVASRLDAQQMQSCSLCGGLGWFITAANRKQICRHQG
ncbi:MAG: hypothetical protein ABSD74_11865 [Rhizomicrobium sp.]|jgi:hypothetical protein